jgi:Domain of unknown function (DUF397)
MTQTISYPVIGKWTTSSLSMTNGNCVEVMVFDDGSADVRNGRKPDEGVLHFTPGEWHDFLAGSRTASSAESLVEARGPGAVVRRPGLSFST